MSEQPIDFKYRQTSTGVAPLFVERWSPRAFQKASIDGAVMQRIMDAARWSPSCFNAQPWRFYTSTEATFDKFLNLLVDDNQRWAKDCAVIGFLVCEKNFEHNGSLNPFSNFDSGAAWMSLTLQARFEGFYTHGMGGIKAEEVSEFLNLDHEQSEVLMGFAIGKLIDLNKLDDEQRENETPNTRKELSEIWHAV